MNVPFSFTYFASISAGIAPAALAFIATGCYLSKTVIFLNTAENMQRALFNAQTIYNCFFGDGLPRRIKREHEKVG